MAEKFLDVTAYNRYINLERVLQVDQVEFGSLHQPEDELKLGSKLIEVLLRVQDSATS